MTAGEWSRVSVTTTRMWAILALVGAFVLGLVLG
jgi:hypothetical protein